MTEEEIGKINRKLQKMIDKSEVVSSKIDAMSSFHEILLGWIDCTGSVDTFTRITYYIEYFTKNWDWQNSQ